MSIQGTPPGGPYVSVAVFCDAVLRELDGTESLIRLRRRVSVPVSPTGPVNPVPLTLLIALQSGEAKGRQTSS